MTQETALLLVFALLGFASFGWLRRLAPPLSEAPLKLLMAALFAATVGGSALLGAATPELFWPSLAAAIAWIGVPLLLPALARSGRWGAARRVARLLYWSDPGRDAMARLLTQVALQQGDGARALSLLPQREGASMAAQAYALQRDWAAVLELELPPIELAPMAHLSRLEALLALGELQPARSLAERLRASLEVGPPDPLRYRATILGEALIDAEEGNLRRLQETLQEPPEGVPVARWYELLARASVRIANPQQAARFYREAYRTASEAQRPIYAAELERLEVAPPELPPRVGRGWATSALVGLIGLSYLGQVVLDVSVLGLMLGGQPIAASSLAAAFVVGVAGFPLSEAPWRYLSYALLHGNLLHIGFNAWVLLDLGRIVEARRGPGYLWVAFVLGAVVGALLTASMTVTPTLLVGASGGVLGVAGALLADASRRLLPGDRQLLRGLVQWLALIAFLSLTLPFVSWWGHLGGLLGGLAWGFARQGLPKGRRLDSFLGGVAALALAWALGQALRVASLLW